MKLNLIPFQLFLNFRFKKSQVVMTRKYFIAVFFLILLNACGPADQKDRIIPLYNDLSKYHREITTSSPEAQKYFDQGFVLYYGFNHEAAIKSFQQAIMLDSTCAMAWWGQAISAGPNINNPVMDSIAKVAAWQTIVEAQKYTEYASPVEKMLIEALAKRYTWPAPDNRKYLDSAYASAMREVYLAFPDDPDVGALYADALMNLRPWDYWTQDGEPQPGTLEIVSVLEHVQGSYPGHPGACHFFIHTMEASPTPELALPAADTLRNRVPGAGHLVHMPSHIDIRLGHYKEAIEANERAIKADSIWIQSGGKYTIYRAHNYHFLAYAAMFDGQKDLALWATNSMIDKIPMDMVLAFPDFLDGFIAVPIHVMVRFGMWDEILLLPKPDSSLLLTQAFWHYGRAIAYAATGKVAEARAENDSLAAAYERVPDSRLIGNNPGKTVLDIGVLMARGELEYREGNYDTAFSLLRKAVEKDDALKYDEPWGWMMPVRHALGALLLEQRRLDEAEAVYTKDLQMHPDNGWALKGLCDCLKLEGRDQEAKYTEALFRKAWSRSDTPLNASCFCSKGIE
jgi:tetratricopeptide (TPR) repeat protein